MAVRTIGSPLRFTSRPMVLPILLFVLLPSCTSRPVSIRPQVPALTRMDELRPRWDSQSAPASLSAISFSAVSSSGTLSRASARHINTTPSSEDKSYSCIKASSTPCSCLRALTREMRSRAAVSTRSLEAASSFTESSNCPTN